MNVAPQSVAWTSTLATELGGLRIDAGQSLDAVAQAATASVRTNGFALLRGLSADAVDLDDRLRALGNALGRVIVQSPRGELVEDVRDVSDLEEQDDRGYRSGGEMVAHSDPPTLIVLHCVTAALSGGETHLVNVAAIRDRIAADHPTSLAVLQQPFPMWRVDGQGAAPAGPDANGPPVLAQRNGVLSCVLYRPFIENAADALGVPLTSAQVDALDCFDLHAADPALSLRFLLRPGETMILHNRAVLHARTDYVDWPELHRRRHLKRLWIDAPELLPVHRLHELGDIFAVRR